MWNKKSEKVREHEQCMYHQNAMEKAADLKQAVEHPHIKGSREVLKYIARAVLYCGRQCIAQRGDAENLNRPGNPGNFLALVKVMAIDDDVLHSHLEAPAMRCVTNMSPQTQNELK